MSESVKSAVLAKCQDAKNHKDRWIPVGDDSSGLALEYFTDGLSPYFQIGSPSHVLCLKFNEETHSDSYVWPLAAQILNLILTVDEFESETSARQYAHDLEQARKEGYEAARAENRPSDALLASAFLCGAQCGFDDSRYSSVRECPAFGLFLSTLPPDTLQADRETLRQILPQLEAIWDCGEFDEPYVPELIRIVRRVAGLEVGNG